MTGTVLFQRQEPVAGITFAPARVMGPTLGWREIIPSAVANPCNQSAAQRMAGASDCVVPQLQTTATQNPCAAAKPANPCNPCAAADPCNPCNPCAVAEAVELTRAEASAAYACIKGVMNAAYAGKAKRGRSLYWLGGRAG